EFVPELSIVGRLAHDDRAEEEDEREKRSAGSDRRPPASRDDAGRRVRGRLGRPAVDLVVPETETAGPAYALLARLLEHDRLPKGGKQVGFLDHPYPIPASSHARLSAPTEVHPIRSGWICVGIDRLPARTAKLAGLGPLPACPAGERVRWLAQAGLQDSR